MNLKGEISMVEIIEKLIAYAKFHLDLGKFDEVYVRNLLLHRMDETEPFEGEIDINAIKELKVPDILIEELKEKAKEVNEKLGVTIVIITHELDVVKTICNKVVVMKDGSVVERGDVYSVFTDPQHPFTQELLAHEQNFKLPAEIWNTATGGIYRLVYKGDAATDSVLSEVTVENHVKFSILHGKIEYIAAKPLGILYVTLQGEEANVAAVVEKLQQRIFRVEKQERDEN